MWYRKQELAYYSAIQQLENSAVADNEKTIILDAVKELQASRVGMARATKYLLYMRKIAEEYPPTQIDKKKLIEFLNEINMRPVAKETKRDYKLSLKILLKYIGKHELADVFACGGIEDKRVPKNYLTVDEILKMVSSSHPHIRNKAIASCFFESGCRPKEFFNLKTNDIQFVNVPVQYGNNGSTQKGFMEVCFLNVNGKTGPRRPFLVFSVPWLRAWLKLYDGVATQTEHVWIQSFGYNKGYQLDNEAVTKAVRTLAHDADIGKHITLYSFRHGMQTYASEILTEAQQNEFAGWIPGSKMPKVYIHLSGQNMLEPLLSPFGIQVQRQETNRNAWIQIHLKGMEALNEK